MQKYTWHVVLLTGLFLLLCGLPLQSTQAQSLSSGEIENLINQARAAGVPESEITRLKNQYYGNSGGGASAVPKPPVTTRVDTPKPKMKPAPKIKPERRDSVPPRPRIVPDKKDVPNIFGHAIFADSSYAALDGGSLGTPLSYIIGPGDELAVNASGSASLSTTFTVATDGSIYEDAFSYLGKIYVAGLTFEKASNTLKSRLKRYLAGSPDISVTLSPQSRQIKVNISGQVRQPGTYALPAATSAFNALFAAGGVNPLGSVRNIQVRRNGKLIQTLDLYDFLSTGNSPPVYLQDRDFLFIPVQGRIVELTGKVKQPMKYELAKGEDLFAAIAYAGGLRFDALRDRAQIKRFQSDQPRIIDIQLAKSMDSKKDVPLADGDIIDIKKQQREITNLVQVDGAVYYPDTYEVQSGETFMDLIERAGGLKRMAFLERAYIARLEARDSVQYMVVNLAEAMTNMADTNANPPLRYLDRIIIFSEEDFREEKYLLVNGEIRKRGAYRVTSDMSLRDLLYLAGGPTVDADLRYVELSALVDAAQRDRLRKVIARLKEGQSPYFIPQEKIDTVSLPRPIKDGFDEDEVLNEDGETAGQLAVKQEVVFRVNIGANWRNNRNLDTVQLLNFDRVKLYSKFDFSFQQFIDVDGAVQSPGRYQVKPGMTVLDLLYQAGGIIKDAEASYIDLFRKLDVTAQSILSEEADTDGIVRINLDEDWRESFMADSIKASDFKRIYIYDKREFFPTGAVNIKGLVATPGKYDLLPGMTLRDLLFQAGGPSLQADLSRIEIARVVKAGADGFTIGETEMLDVAASEIQSWRTDAGLDIPLRAFDQVFIRKNPDFELQDVVYVKGEVRITGAYAIEGQLLKLDQLITRTDDLTERAYARGAYIQRPNIGKISISLEKALKQPNSRHNIDLLAGDTLVVPPRLNIVEVRGNVIQPGTIVQFDPKKRSFKHYVDLAGGFDRRSVRKRSVVEYQDGRVKRPHSFIFFRTYPRIEQGSEIRVAKKPEKQEGEKKERDPLTFQEVLAGLTAAATLLLLVRQSL
ncbi:MAG: SLBB domain-containing protein [Bacteroidia bacterium]